MASSSQDRNLPASERRLQQARDDGQVARSRYLPHLAVLGSGAAAVMVLLPGMLDRLKVILAEQLSFNAQTMLHDGELLTRLQDMTFAGMTVAVIFSAIVLSSAIVSTVATGGWVLSLKPLMPDFSRINPLSGFGRLFSKEQLTETLKLVVIAGIVSTIAILYLTRSMDQLATLVLQPSSASLRYLANWLTIGLGLMLLVVGVVAAIDVPLQIYLHKSRLKMSHEEVRKEHKENDGNPQMKSRRRQRQREIAQRNSVAAVPKADFVVMNPTHYAVALKYDEDRMGAPQVVSKGADLLALKIREIAKNHNVPVLQSPRLARALYAHAELDREIPSALFSAVAQVLAYVYRLKASMRGEGPAPGDLPEPMVPPELDPHNATTPAAQPT